MSVSQPSLTAPIESNIRLSLALLLCRSGNSGIVRVAVRSREVVAWRLALPEPKGCGVGEYAR